MKIEPIKQIEQLNYKKNITTWEEFDEIYKFNDPVKDPDKQQIVSPEEYRPDDNGCIGNKLNILV